MSVNPNVECFVCHEQVGEQLATFGHILHEHPEVVTSGQIMSMGMNGRQEMKRLDTGETVLATQVTMIVRQHDPGEEGEWRYDFLNLVVSEEYTDWFLRHLEVARQQQADHPRSSQPVWRVVLRNAWTTFRHRWGLWSSFSRS